MKYVCLLICPLIVYNSVYCQNTIIKNVSAEDVLKHVSQYLNSIKSIRYNLKRELNYASENYHNESTWKVYYDFQSTDTIIGFKYQIEDETAKQVFNGTEKFEMDKKVKTIKINEQPNEKLFVSNSAFYNSIITLKNALPLLIADKNISGIVGDTTVANTSYYSITLNLNKKRIQNLGKGFDAMTTKSNFIYKILVDKKNYSPYEVLQVNDADNDFIKTNFTNIDTNSTMPLELSWYYSTYIGEYKMAVQKELPQLISVDSYAPQWTLPLYNKDENISLDNFKGNVVLLDFWIKNCGPCINSIPDLNALMEKYKGKKFEILGINSYDAKGDISWFCNKHKPDYKNLMQGKSVAEKYGVAGFPTVVLIDKNGKVLYAGASLETSKMERLINKAL